MSDVELPVTDASVTDASASAPLASSPFTMVDGDTAAMVCEGDVCYVPGLGGE